MLTLEQLTTPVTEDEALATLLSIATELGFQATSWQTGSAQVRFFRLLARTWSKVSSTVSLIAAGGFTSLAATTEGASGFLRLLARYFYDIEPLEAQPTIGKILLTSSPGAPVHTWSAGDMIIANEEQGIDGAITFTCTEGGTLGPDSSITIEFKADVAGTSGNLAPNTPLFFWTPYVGVTATNPALLPASNTWITTPGEDEESDQRLFLRCMGRWSRLSYSNIDGAYVGWALEALPALTRVTIDSSPGDGTVRIIGATALGGLSPTQITTIEDYINGVNDGVGRRPINDIVSAVSADTVTTPALTVTAYVITGIIGVEAAELVIAQKLLAFIGQQPIGGVRLQGSQGRILFDDLLETAKTAAPGIRSVSLSITEDVILAIDEIYLPAITVNAYPVAPGI